MADEGHHLCRWCEGYREPDLRYAADFNPPPDE